MKKQTSENFIIALFFILLLAGIFIDLGPVCMTAWNPTIGECR
jgi:hypothetical protein